jgi:CubicO group peptidase (beta-lactamase class C family)
VYSYSNLSLIVAGRLIEVVTAELYEDAVKDLILTPLGLPRTGYTTHRDIYRHVASGLVWLDGAWANATGVPTSRPVPRIHNPSGGLLSTARDMVRFLRCHLDDGGLVDSGWLGEGTIRSMRTPQLPAVGPRNMGLGWSILQTDPLVFRHGGSMPGFVASCAGCPESGAGVAVLTNWQGADPVVVGVEAMVMERLAGARFRFAPDSEALAGRWTSYVGSYRLPTGRSHDVEITDGRLTLVGDDPNRTGQVIALAGDAWGVLESDLPMSLLVGFDLDEHRRATAINVGGRWLPRVDA